MLAWYGDDFTGAAAVMEVLEFSGFPSVLFLSPPTPAVMARFLGLSCFGIAGDARTRGPDGMDANLPGIFAAPRGTGAGIMHNKMRSTLDSAPHVGSVGRAAAIGLGNDPWAPVLVAAPRIGRWQTFGTLFARHAGGIARLDRHPIMARRQVFALGSQGVEEAIVAAATAQGHMPPPTRPAGPVDRTAIASGSCSPDTAA